MIDLLIGHGRTEGAVRLCEPPTPATLARTYDLDPVDLADPLFVWRFVVNTLRARGTVDTIGVDPGMDGAIVAVDASGAHLWSIRLRPLYVDEAEDGPRARALRNSIARAQRSRVRAERERGVKSGEVLQRLVKPRSGQRAKRRISATHSRTIARLLTEVAPGADCAMESLLYLNTSVHGSDRERTQSRQAAGTTDENHGRLYGLLAAAGYDPVILPPARWQPLILPPGRDTKTRSLAAARAAGFDTTHDGEADAHGIARAWQALRAKAWATIHA